MKILISAILSLGSSGIIAQILLLREMLIAFYGNELVIGVILANWLLLEAIGSFFFGKRAEHLNKQVETFITLQLIFAIFLPLTIFLIRNLKYIFGMHTGEGFGILAVFLGSFFIFLPISITHGALFTFSCKLYNLYTKEKEVNSISKVYIYETIGTIIGGIIFTYFFIPYFNSLQIALILSLLNFIFCILILYYSFKKSFNDKISMIRKMFFIFLQHKFLTFFSFGCAILTILILFSPIQNKLHKFSLKSQWRGQDILYYRNSIYGNIAVAQRDEQFTFYTDGVPIITTPTPDIVFIEEFAHLTLLSHLSPKRILLISAGVGGLINEILKHPTIEQIDYIELDYLLLKALKQFSTPLIIAELTHPKLQIHHIDGRLFLKKQKFDYDVILVGLSFPSDLQINRFFTSEFFSLAKKHLKKDGILAISLFGSLTYLTEELKNLNSSVLNALRGVFSNIRIIPGDEKNIFLASDSQNIILTTSAHFIEQLIKRNINTTLITPQYIDYKLQPQWLDWFLKSLKEGTIKSNKDFTPRTVFYSLSYWNALFSPSLRNIFKWLERITFWDLIYLIIGFTLILLVLSLKIKKYGSLSIPYCIFTTGFAGMIFDLLLIFTFQLFYGYVFYWIGLLVTTFTVGIVIGSLLMMRFLFRLKNDLTFFLKLEVSVITFSFLLPLIFLKFSSYLDRAVVYYSFHLVFLLLSFISGVLVGAEFPLASKIQFGRFNLSTTAGLLYSADLLGGWLGGIFGAMLLLPLLGIFKTCMVVVMFKMSSLFLLFLQRFS